MQSGKKNKPGAFSITVLHARSEQEREQIGDYSRQIGSEMLAMPEFISWTGIVVGDRMMTVTAWDNAESPRWLTRQGTHVETMQKFFGPELASRRVYQRLGPRTIRRDLGTLYAVQPHDGLSKDQRAVRVRSDAPRTATLLVSESGGWRPAKQGIAGLPLPGVGGGGGERLRSGIPTTANPTLPILLRLPCPPASPQRVGCVCCAR